MVRKPVTTTMLALWAPPRPNTCEAPVCNVEHEFELPILVFLLPLLIFLSVTILLRFNGLLLLHFGVIYGRTDPRSFTHPKGTASLCQALAQVGTVFPHPQGPYCQEGF